MSSTPIPEEDIQDRTSDSEGPWGEAVAHKMNGGPPDDNEHQDEPDADDGGDSSGG
jgi:hypothetical protein